MLRDTLERRYDGPVPLADPARPKPPPAVLRARLFDELAGTMRAQAAKRRAASAFAEAERAAGHLACYRAHGVAWLGHAKGGAG